MQIYHFTNKNAVQLLATQSRRADINSFDLCKIHFEMGKYLAYQILDEFELVENEIHHVQGIKKGVELLDKNNIVIISLLRAGLYAAEGVRSVFTDSMFILESNDIEKISEKYDFQNKIIIIVDAVVNTGKSMLKIIEKLQKKSCKKIMIATLILQKEALILFESYQTISFYALRISENKYVGKGGTDTGNRLFNTFYLE
jgi:uracil phosphoribosyltransferase